MKDSAFDTDMVTDYGHRSRANGVMFLQKKQKNKIYLYFFPYMYISLNTWFSSLHSIPHTFALDPPANFCYIVSSHSLV